VEKKKKCILAFIFYGGGGGEVPPVEIHHELVTVYGGNVMAVHRVHEWFREFDHDQVSVKDEQRSRLPSTSADPIQNSAAVRAERCVLLN
jgi:hypothetical protein